MHLLYNIYTRLGRGEKIYVLQTAAGNQRLKAILTLTEKKGPGHTSFQLCVQLDNSHVYPGPTIRARQ